MAATQIHGFNQIQDATIKNQQVASDAAIATSKLADSANFIMRGGSVAFTGNQSMGSNRLTNLADATAGTDAPTWTQVQNLLHGLKWKTSVKVATTAAGTLASSFENGDTVDGVTLSTGDRILIKDQAAGAENGIYTVNASGAPTRATDADTGAELVSAQVPVEQGTVNADKVFCCTNNSITLGTTALTFTSLPSVTGALIAANNLSDLANAGTARTNLGLSANGSSLVTAADYAAMRALLDLEAGTDFLAFSLAAPLASPTFTGTPAAPTATTGTNTTQLATTAFVQQELAAAGIGDFSDRETPTGTVNGSNTAFTLANTPTSGSEHVYLNGLLQDPGGSNDYTISGATITFVTAPPSGSKIRVSYRY